jgi:sortase A
MKGRSLPGNQRSHAHSAARTRVGAVLLVAIATSLAGCGGSDDVAVLPAESIDQALLAASEATQLVIEPATTAAPTTSTPATSSTAPATSTTVAPTAPPTIVETLPQPLPPPEPRADEPYLELGTIEVPKLGLSQPLLEGITLNTLDLGPGHWPGTAMPGHLGNAVIAGHRTSHGKVFRNIDQLVAGDEVIFTTPEGRFVYIVTETVVVAPDALYIIEQTQATTATLFACHPPGSTRQRIVVHMTLQDITG